MFLIQAQTRGTIWVVSAEPSADLELVTHDGEAVAAEGRLLVHQEDLRRSEEAEPQLQEAVAQRLVGLVGDLINDFEPGALIDHEVEHHAPDVEEVALHNVVEVFSQRTSYLRTS